MKKILIISYYYPPLNDVGRLRALAFSKYLPEFGWQPYVLSVKNPDKGWCILGNSKPPSGIKVYYTWSLINLTRATGKLNGLLAKILHPFGINLNKPLIRDLFCIPDQFIGWIPLTFLKGLDLIRKNNIDAIYVSCKPFSSAIIGALLKYVTKKPLVLDFRDPISPIFFILKENYYKYLPTFCLIKKIEERVLYNADKFIVVTKKMKNLYLSDFPFLNNKIHVVYNGFMEEYFSINPKPFEKFTIVYTGNFYAEMIPPDPFFKALQLVINENSSLKDEIQFLYVGKNADWLKTMVKKYDLHDVVKVTGYVPHQKSIEYIFKSSILLVRILTGALGTKIFEGLAAGVPLLVLTEEEEAKAIIKKYSNNFYIIEPNNVLKIAKAIKDAYEKWISGNLRHEKNENFWRTFSRKYLTLKFVKILENLYRNAND